jgi:hypothetical protein
MSEPFPFDVAYDTSFEQLEALREKMLKFLKTENRDFSPVFDVVVAGMCSIVHVLHNFEQMCF